LKWALNRSARAHALDCSVTGPAALTARERPEEIPLSPAQRRLWFLSRLDGPGATYHLPLCARLSGPLDRDALRDALGDVVARHESLRTVFPDTGGRPRQLVLEADQARPELRVCHATEFALAADVSRAAGTGFDLSSELPLRAHLFVLSPTEHVLLVVLHHIVGDGWSLAPLARDLGEAYAARRGGAAPEWVALPVQYADYTLWQRQVLGDEEDSGSELAGQVGYWREALAGLPEELTLPVDRARPARMSYRGATETFRVDADVHRRLAALAREHGASVFMVIQAGLAALLSRLGAGEDIPLGSPIAGRTDEGLEELVGFFVNTLVLRTDVSGDPTFAELVERVREADLAAYAHQQLTKMGVEIRTGAEVTEVTPTAVHLADGASIETETVIWTAGVQASPAGQWLEVETDKAGRIQVDGRLRVPGLEDVYVIGDTALALDERDQPLPGLAQVAKQQGRYLGRALARKAAGQPWPGPFRFRNYGNMAVVGRNAAVADLGWWRTAGFIAWLLWGLVHIYLLIGFRNKLVVTVTWLWSYLTYQRGARLITGERKAPLEGEPGVRA
jgi:hypothetical protein